MYNACDIGKLQLIWMCVYFIMSIVTFTYSFGFLNCAF